MALKSAEKERAQSFAHRWADDRSKRFETQGFKSNDPTPSLAKCNSMASFNRRLINSQSPQPIRRG